MMMKEIIKKISIEDVFIISGLLCITIASFLLSKIIGFYTLGLILTSLGVLIVRR